MRVKILKQSQMRLCPFCIMLPSHYREDGTCMCDDPKHRAKMIKHWGYRKEDFKGIPLREEEVKDAR